MEKIKTIVVLLLSLSIFAFPGCSRERRRGPLDVLRVTYVACGGDINHVEVFIITSDRKVTQYSIEPEPDKSYDYLAGELPSEDR